MTSLTALLSFLVMLITSIILYIVPQGRVAYWADWRLWGLTKEQWGAIHINTGLLFLISLVIHIYYNWSAILLYLKNKSKGLKIFTKEFNAALIILLVFIFGTHFKIPPFSTILNISEGIKDEAALKYGEPPYGHAELSSLNALAKKQDIDLSAAMTALKTAGYKVDNTDQTIKEVASDNNVSPQQIYLAMTSAQPEKPASLGLDNRLPESPVAGTGNLTLKDFCLKYQIDLKVIKESLQTKNITFKEDMTLKKIASMNSKSPVDLYDLIRSITLKGS